MSRKKQHSKQFKLDSFNTVWNTLISVRLSLGPWKLISNKL